LELLKQGLAYQKEAVVNWDPVDKTVLANEQVDDNGCSWRSGAKVEQKMLTQWFLRITAFAEDLHKDLEYLSQPGHWPDRVVAMQRNWLGKSKSGDNTTWRLQDWLISRQRYWGTPIPIIHCDDCGPVPVPVEDLPVKLPSLPPDTFSGRGGSPLEKDQDWLNTSCPSCGKAAKRETDTMDTFMDSSWYFLRFTDPANTEKPFEPVEADSAMPVDFYIGGVEHAILHLLYARFLSKCVAQWKWWNPDGPAEPFKKLVTQGMVHGRTLTDPDTGRYLKPEEVDLADFDNPLIAATGKTPNINHEKMSKSKYNGVDPLTCISKYGADATRAHILFQAPESEVLNWNEGPIVGIIRSSLRRLADQAYELNGPIDLKGSMPEPNNVKESQLIETINGAINEITLKYAQVHGLNTVVSDLFKLSNTLEGSYQHITKQQSTDDQIRPVIFARSVGALTQLMAPVLPAWAEQSWQTLLFGPEIAASPSAPSEREYASILHSGWPEPSSTRKIDAGITCTIQLNGKVRLRALNVPAPDGTSDTAIQNWVHETVLNSSEKARQFAKAIGKNAAVNVYAGGKVVNIIVPVAADAAKKT
jgi:leucyl-tRNA synthetase